ncbi:IS256 family transposase [Marinobacter sp.]|jgi:transposase-like protein|uniref:IS256 family transposase n=1 Tax=Marinobacter sp. TaxID=50741 RepID=UPI0026235152|nr:IS256 family transposase [Marinobacter sp.]
MSKSTLHALSQPEPEQDLLHETIRHGARKLIAEAVDAELTALLEQYADRKTPEGHQAVVRNGHLPQRRVQTGVGDIEVQVPKVRDRSESGIRFNSTLLPPYLKRAKSLDELIPWPYLRGVSSGDFQEALTALVGEQAQGLSANTVSRLKARWQDEHKVWQRRDLSQKRYVYWWADGVYSNVRMDNKLCLLVIVGVTEHGRKELVAVEDGHRESEASWLELLQGLKSRHLDVSPKLAVGDGALGFWKALTKAFPETRHQRCWVHKTANVLDKLPRAMQPKVKSAIHEIYLAETREAARKAFDSALRRFQDKYPKAMDCLEKDREELLAFYDFPAVHWIHLRTTNPIESTFATVRLRTKKSRGCGSRETTLAMVFKLMQTAQNRWKRIKGFQLLELVVNNVEFRDGEAVEGQSDRNAA